MAPGSDAELAPPAIIYIVRPGDTLTTIARRYGTRVDALVATNHIEFGVLSGDARQFQVLLDYAAANFERYAATPTASPTPARAGSLAWGSNWCGRMES